MPPHETADTPAATTTSRLYISLMRLTDKGLAELAGSPERRKISEERVAALGGRSIAFYATLGTYDFVQVFEMPDNEAMMQYVLTARRDGFVEPLILPAFDPQIFGAIVERVLK
ncbi:GYD domain-containing protein [Mesorhizobium onobrychidis]|uniref:GYD domain-containing protein n=1 Tax=Mesorhizobium onobrychidis TaxID=2775404 RepID=A0ABY5QZ83_9HYPH|nr:GYD domain-containing protein [Mesorhizobium onobrychidis]UVC16536.1 GYD domain-containing protein [Mesorhizobium onobrychidis]